MISGYVSIKQVISKIYRDLGINEEIPEINIVEWIAEALNMIGAYSQYDEISDCLELTNGKAKLPCDFYRLVSINYKGYPVHWATNTNANNYQCDNCQIPVCSTGQCEFTFYLNDSYLISNIDTDNTSNICIVYLGMPKDDNGYPMIPDDVYYMKALSSYVISMIDYQEWRKGKVTDKVMQKSEKDWLFYVGAARGAANMPSLAQMERLKNIWRRMLPLTNEYDRSFINLGKKENRNIS